ncbi:hypothetical protein KEM54_006229 [Ascosphaera aggregata]|nr:hypothetical protein KEM54_006229 [Ascosphaera aggregata]
MLARLRRRPLLRVPSNPSNPQFAQCRRTSQLCSITSHLHNPKRSFSSSPAIAALGGGFARRGWAPKFAIEQQKRQEKEEAERRAKIEALKREEEAKAEQERIRVEAERKKKLEEAKIAARESAERRQQVRPLFRENTAFGSSSSSSSSPVGPNCVAASRGQNGGGDDVDGDGNGGSTRISHTQSTRSPPASSGVRPVDSHENVPKSIPTERADKPSVKNHDAPSARLESTRAFFRPRFSSATTQSQSLPPSDSGGNQDASSLSGEKSLGRPEPSEKLTYHPDSSSDIPNALGRQSQMRPGKLFGSFREQEMEEGEGKQEEQPESEPANDQPTDSIGLDPLEQEIARLKVADSKYVQELAELNDRIREKRKRSGKKALEEASAAETAKPYLTQSERKRRNKIDSEYEEKKRLQEKQRRAAERKRKEQEQKEDAMRKGRTENHLQPINLPEFISVGNLANAINQRPADFVRQLEEFGFEEVSYNHVLDAETASLIAAEFGYEARYAGLVNDDMKDLKPAEKPADTSNLPTRPPVITIMGHVDHGKTTLLDWLRKSSVVSTEHGGITQHIGAFSVTMPSGKVITFLDTPGHAAFLEMRRRGAEVTDIVILVVAANDSVKPQTLEAIKHAKEAGVPMIVAVNKVDLPNVNPDAVKFDLAANGVYVEEQGGDVQCVHVSGKTGEGMVELEEAVVTLSEMLDHRADRTGNVEGWLIESTTKKGGKVATVLVTRGTLRPGKIIVAGKAWARVRSLRDESGQLVKKALPGTPVEVDGWRVAPVAGDQVLQADTEQRAKEVVELRELRDENKELNEDVSAINDARKAELERKNAEVQNEAAAAAATADATTDGEEHPRIGNDGSTRPGPKGVPFIVKADVSGSVEAIVNSISSIGNSEVYARILRSGVGSITTSDIAHAAAAKADIVSFNMPVDPGLKRLAQNEGVRILDYNVIYEVMDEVTVRLSEHLEPNIVHRVTGEAEIGQVFIVTSKAKNGMKGRLAIAGCKINNGVIQRGSKVKVLRDKEVVYTGKINSLKNVKKDVNEMRKGTECGIGFEGFVDFKEGDQVQTFEERIEKRTL